MRRNLKILVGTVGGIVVVLAAVAVLRTVTAESRQRIPEPAAALDFDVEQASRRLASLIQLKTVSTADPAVFEALHAALAAHYPRAHRVLQRENLDGSLLFTWSGQAPDAPGTLLLAHQDVVPIANPSAWTHPPFAGVIKDGFVWGRGALDDKGCIIALFEAVEALVIEGFAPQGNIYLAFGDDEEIGGDGARTMAAALSERGARIGLVLDEGGAIVEGIIPGLDRPAALVGIAEKGYVTLTLTVKSKGGHSSMPPKRTAAGRVAAAAARVEAAPFPMEIREVAAHFMDWLGPEMPFGQRIALVNRWLFSPALKMIYDKKDSTAATLRTTTAVTMLSGGPKSNVLPATATATINFRILPGDTIASVTQRVTELVDDDEVEIEAGPFAAEPSPVSDPDGAAFAAIQTALSATRPDVAVAPFLTVGATDARHYAGLSPNVFRILPFKLNDLDLKRIHGANERVAVEELALGIRFYAALIRAR